MSIVSKGGIRFRIGRLRLTMHPRHLVTAFAVLMLLGIWAAIGHEILDDRAEAREEWSQNVGNLVRSYDEHTQRILRAVDLDLRYVREQYVRHGYVDFSEMERSHAIDVTAYNHIGIVSPRGSYVQVSTPFQPISLADRDYYLVHRNGTADVPYVSVPVVSRVTGRWAVHISRRIDMPDGSFGGVVTATMDPESLSAMYKDTDLGPRSLVTLAGEDGIVRARRLGGTVRSLGDNIQAAPYFHAYKDIDHANLIFNSVVDGQERLYSFRRLKTYKLLVIIGVSMDHVYGRSNERRNGYVAIGAIASLLVLGFTLLVSHLIADLTARRAEAESANRLKSEFLASMSHELRTPLHGILGFSEIIQRKAGEEKMRQHAGTIQNSGKHLLALVNSILDLAKIEAGKMDVYLREEELAPLVRNAVQIHEISALGKGLRLELDWSPTLPQCIYCDPTLFRQVLNNLINNAIKFTEQGGVTVRVERDTRPGFLRVSVQDTGIGIPAEALGLVFEKFRQVDQSMTRSHQGTGLGLSLAKQLVELMGGQISLASRPGEGTTIGFCLPACKSEGGVAGNTGATAERQKTADPGAVAA